MDRWQTLISGAGNLLDLPLRLPDLLGSTRYSKWSVVLLTLWKNTGFTMVIYLAALQGVPQELYDAAHVDGANGWQRFRNVTVPMISPTTFFLFVLQTIGAFQLFTEPFVMTRGGPAQSSDAGCPVHLRQCFPLHPHGQGVGDRLVPVHLHLRLYAHPKHHAAAVGAL